MDRRSEPKPEHLSTPRYSEKSFPPYRFIPGINPHPTRSPEGHSYGVEHSLDKSLAIDGDHPNFLYGVDLYNNAFWWESHEAWEDMWHLTKKEGHAGQFLQGLIQVSAAFIKWYLNEVGGSQRLYKIGTDRLKSVAERHPIYMSVDLEEHLNKLDVHFRIVIDSGNTMFDMFKNYPYLLLKF